MFVPVVNTRIESNIEREDKLDFVDFSWQQFSRNGGKWRAIIYYSQPKQWKLETAGLISWRSNHRRRRGHWIEWSKGEATSCLSPPLRGHSYGLLPVSRSTVPTELCYCITMFGILAYFFDMKFPSISSIEQFTNGKPRRDSGTSRSCGIDKFTFVKTIEFLEGVEKQNWALIIKNFYEILIVLL